MQGAGHKVIRKEIILNGPDLGEMLQETLKEITVLL